MFQWAHELALLFDRYRQRRKSNGSIIEMRSHARFSKMLIDVQAKRPMKNFIYRSRYLRQEDFKGPIDGPVKLYELIPWMRDIVRQVLKP